MTFQDFIWSNKIQECPQGVLNRGTNEFGSDAIHKNEEV